MSENRVYLNGEIVAASEAHVGVFDPGFLHGATVFTTMLARNGRVFRIGRHLARLAGTAGLLGLNVSPDADELSARAHEVLAANELSDARVRVTLSPGDGESPTTLITATPLPEYPPEWTEKGIATVVSSWKQQAGDPTYGNKTGCYLPRVLARQEAAAKGAEEALWYTHDNRLAEACFCNIFLVLGGTVYTPPRDTPILPGIVREAVIELCGQLDIACDESTPLTVHEMLQAPEMFLTASCTGVRPVACVERHEIGEGRPGEITKRILAAYRELVDTECGR